MKKVLMLFGVLVFAFSSIGCGKNSPKPVQSFEIKIPEKDTVDLTLHLGSEYGLPFEKDIEIPLFGELRFKKPHDGVGAEVGVKLNFEMIIKKYAELMPTNNLPNGAAFPSEIVTGKMVQLDIPSLHYPSNLFTFMEPFVYAGIENDRKYVAIALSFRAFSLGKKIEGKSASEIMYAQNLPIFGTTLFGPGMDSVRNRTSLGGLFFVVDVTNAIESHSMTDKNLTSKFYTTGGMGGRALRYVDTLIREAISKIK